jgi:hypothetical protein
MFTRPDKARAAACAVLLVFLGSVALFAQPKAKPPRASDGVMTLAPHLTTRTCMIQITPPVGTAALAVGHATVDACSNEYGSDWVIKTASCYADSGTPTVTIKAQTATSVTQTPLPCGDHTWKSAPVVGTPTLRSFSGLGSTCAEPPCDLSAAVATVTGVSHYVIIRLTGQL